MSSPIYRILSAVLADSVFLLLPISASAEEVGWSAVDWTIYDWGAFRDDQWDSLSDWLRIAGNITHDPSGESRGDFLANCGNFP